MLTAFITVLLSCMPSDLFYWIKRLIAYVTIRYYNSKHRKRFDIYKPNAVGDPEKLGFLVPQIEIDLEYPQTEKHLQNSTDSATFYGVNSKAECVLIHLNRYNNQSADAWIFLKLADGTTYQLKEPMNYQHSSEEEESSSFSCGNLHLQVVSPMRRWRIEYSGYLLEKSEGAENSEKEVFVKFVFLWCASSDVYDPTIDTNIRHFTHLLALKDWKSIHPPLQELRDTLNFYSQVGNLRGTISVANRSEYEMFLFGDRQRNLGNRHVTAAFRYPTLVGYVPQNGFGFHLLRNISEPFLGLKAGFAINPDGNLKNINKTEIPHEILQNVSQKITFSTVNDVTYELNGLISKEHTTLENRDMISKITFLEFSVMNKTGYGLHFSSELKNVSKENDIPLVRKIRPQIVPLVLKLTDEASLFGDISGGKGASLGKLLKLSTQNKTFTVPKGLIVTTSAYDMFLNSNISKAIKDLENVVYGNVEGDVKDACNSVINIILNSALPDQICKGIAENLNFVFGEEFEKVKFAVRSSATGEDTDVMSAAGQMDTYLGVQGLKNIFLAVKKCWSSQFGHIAVEYKRQHGQLLNSPMAVVVQEMVACEVSGVMFTCDPASNNPNIITITANFGLGETVVSGSVEPDTFILKKNEIGAPTLETMTVGSKLQKEVMNESGGTRLEELPEDKKSSSCLATEAVVKLGKLAVEVEKFYRSSRDIEWGIEKNIIYLFQSRPVTSGSLVTDFELKHEFNTILRCERDYFTVANVGEVLPGATPPLAGEMCSKLFAKAMQKFAFDRGMAEIMAKRIYCPCDMFYYQIVMSVPEITCRHGHDTILSKGILISIFGRVLEEKEIYEVAKERFPSSMKPPLWVQLFICKELMTYHRGLDTLKKEVEGYDLPFMKCRTAAETFNALLKSSSDFLEPAIRHMICSGNSSHWNSILFAILVKAKGRIDADVYSDFSKILATTSHVESADVPAAIQKVTNQIVTDIGVAKFKEMSLEEAEEWLINSNTQSSKLYQDFIARHGHRCLKEFTINALTWKEDQRSLIKLMKASVGNTKEVSKKSNKSYSELFSELSTLLSYWDRLLLRFVIPNGCRGVSCRETTKSLIIKCMDYWRQGFRRLSEQMVAEGRIPDKDLLYFMMLDEIKSLLKTRDPKIIIRSNQRRKIFPTLQKYELPEIIRGYPMPDDLVQPDTTSYPADFTIEGVPVSQGVVKGYARVATSLEEASFLKPGEILIAFSTDIGWSPYFPIISGIATELGGLISHGAVVSREYGLPCVVGVRGATKQFKTGDYVLLDGKRGILQKLPQPKSSNNEGDESMD